MAGVQQRPSSQCYCLFGAASFYQWWCARIGICRDGSWFLPFLGLWYQWTASQESLARLTIYTMLIDVSQPTTIYVGTNIGAFRSNDNGQNWSGMTQGIPTNQPVYALLFGNTGGSQIYAAANDVYANTGSSSGFGIGQLLSIVLIVFFFYLLYRLTKGSRSRRREILKPERIMEASPAQKEKDDHPVSQ